MLLFHLRILIVVGILVSGAVSELFEELRVGIPQVKRDRKIPGFMEVLLHSVGDPVDEIRFWSPREVDGKLEQEKIAFRHTDFLDGLVGVVGEHEGEGILDSDILGGESEKSPRDVERILSGVEHPADPVARGIGIAVPQGFVDRRDDVVVLVGIPIIVHP